MKRVLTFLAIMLLPLSVMAMTPVSDEALSDVTGQAGVNINADLTMDIEIGTMAWGDQSGLDSCFGWDTTSEYLGILTSGYVAGDGPGYVGITGFNIYSLVIRARTNDTYNGYDYTAHDLATPHLKPITIDVATDLDGSVYGAGITFVRIGLGSLEISMADLDFAVELGMTTGLGQELGVVYIGGLELYISPLSYIDIFNGTGTSSGVTMNMNIQLDKIVLEAVSWGDSDGVLNDAAFDWMTGTAAAGYVGLTNIDIGQVTVVGAVSIDINSSTDGTYFDHKLAFFNDEVAPVLTAGGGGALVPALRPVSTTVVHFTFGYDGAPFSIDVLGPITADVKLSDAAALDTLSGTSTLGDIYISSFGVDIFAGSWVDIWAH